MNGKGHRDTAERLDWLQLYRCDHVGPVSFRALLATYGDARSALDALPDIAARGGARRPRLFARADAEKELDALDQLGGFLVTLGEPDFPALLAEADGAPPLLSVIGSREALTRNAVAIVGGRNASAAGRTFAGRLATELGASGHLIVSGLARGIDAAAHRGSLRTGTVAAIAGGLNRIYPPEHIELLDEMIAAGGAVVTEMPMGWTARAQDFPRRNRIIAGMAHGTIVVEAALRSGSLITARLAGEMGREVMAVPGSPLDPRCEGTNALIRDGATLVACAAHVTEALAPLGLPLFTEAVERPALRLDGDKRAARAAVPTNDMRLAVERLLSPSPVTIDDLVRLSGVSAQAVQMVLLELELGGRLERLAGSRIALTG